jgi:hypothetical protein
MRLAVFASLSCISVIASLVACTAEEFPNPPATRDGTEATGEETNAALPPPSTTSKPPSSSSGGIPDAGDPDEPKPVGPTSGVDPDKSVGSLSSSEKKQLCDWQAGKTGGYGKTTKCEGGISLSNPKSQAACVQKLPASCAATVAQVEECVKVDAVDPCALAILSAPECEPLRACAQ